MKKLPNILLGLILVCQFVIITLLVQERIQTRQLMTPGSLSALAKSVIEHEFPVLPEPTPVVLSPLSTAAQVDYLRIELLEDRKFRVNGETFSIDEIAAVASRKNWEEQPGFILARAEQVTLADMREMLLSLRKLGMTNVLIDTQS